MTLIEKLWAEMDGSYSELVEMDRKAKSSFHYAKAQGVCVGLAKALAIMSTPMSYEEVRDEAARRHEAHQAGEHRPIPEPHRLERRY